MAIQYEKWSLGYWVLKQYVRFVDWVIHNKTIIVGKENIPKEKPILLTPNHQNGLSDALAILLNTKLQPVWLARADMFRNKTLAAILRFMKIMPVYRLCDGKNELAKNDKTFADSVKILENNGVLALFPEGTHTGKRQMIAHKKAASRIVFLAEEKTRHNLDIQIIPTGLNYNSYWKFNRNLIVNFGKPITVNSFLEEYKENPKTAALSLRKSIYEGIDKLIINIRSKKYYSGFEQIIKFYGKHYLGRQNKKYSIVSLLKSNQKLTKKLDEIETENPEEVELLVNDVNGYNALLKKYKVRSWLVEKPHNNFWKIAINKLILLAGLPIFIYGFLLNAIPFFTIDTIVRKKMRDKTFWSSLFLALGLVVFPIVYLLEFLALAWVFSGVWLKLAFFVSLPFAGKLAFKWYILFRKTIGRSRLLLLKIFNPQEYKGLLNERDRLFGKIDKLISIE